MDSGFTLAEVIVAMGLITTLMAALAPFLFTTLRALTQQDDRQAAVVLAASAMERVRAAAIPPPGTPLSLPPPTVSMLDGIAYTVGWAQQACGRPASAAADACGDIAADDITYYRVTIAVTWRDNRCQLGTCAYTTATLVNTDADPLFDVQ